MTDDPVRAALARHDQTLRDAGFDLWIGAEPTFTDPLSQDPAWLVQPEGGDKLERAEALAKELRAKLHHAATTERVEGRQFPEEPAPRFAFAVRWPDGDRDTALTVTPDPGVIEVNMAPSRSAETFLAQARVIYAAAEAMGLSPRRWRYNGREVDSGGGGQITFGGPSPERSPFFDHPAMLPGLVRYLQRHPSLSYLFANDCVGGASQGPRPDEGVRERWEELPVALDHLDSLGGAATPEVLWSTLAPLLVDSAGNSHRAEVNVEKLWNPHLPSRGMLGLVELRSLRMPPTPERLAAVGCLFRSVCARVAKHPYTEALREWGADLHGRFALPSVLRDDLDTVLSDLDAHGFGLDPELVILLRAPTPPRATVTLGNSRLTVVPALEFYALVGDVASQERSGARLVDPSTERVELRVDTPDAGEPGVLRAGDTRVPLRRLREGVWVVGLRWRPWVPNPGLHPTLPALEPLVLRWSREGSAVELSLYDWIPGGGAYPGPPTDGDEAERRRAERVVQREVEADPPVLHSIEGEGAWTVDLRRSNPVATPRT